MTDTLTTTELNRLARLAALMIPASAEFGVPGADDPTVIADIAASLGRDLPAVRAALAAIGEAAEEAAIRAAAGAGLAVLSRVILAAYYRDPRVVRSLGREPRPPFPQGHMLEQGDWSLLDPVRARPPMWRPG